MSALNLLALLPCPLKVPIEEAFTELIVKEKADYVHGIKYRIEGNANKQIDYSKQIDEFSTIDDVPDIVITPGINNFYYKSFIEKFVDKGFFIDILPERINESFISSDIRDPLRNFTILSMNLLVMVVDKDRLGDLPMPENWGDILNAKFKDKVAIRGKDNTFCETTLLTIYKKYGLEGIEALANSVRYGWHPSQMVKMAGSGKEDSPAVSVMPYFYTKLIRKKDKIAVVWPKDGAMVSPVTMLFKKLKLEQLSTIGSFFCSERVGRICSEALFPTLIPGVENKIPKDAALNWIGWDFIRNNDIGYLMKNINKSFLDIYSNK